MLCATWNIKKKFLQCWFERSSGKLIRLQIAVGKETSTDIVTTLFLWTIVKLLAKEKSYKEGREKLKCLKTDLR